MAPAISSLNSGQRKGTLKDMGQKKSFFLTDIRGDATLRALSLGALKSMYSDGTIVYVGAGQEVAPTTGAEHWHALVIFKKKTRATALIKLIGQGIKIDCAENWDASGSFIGYREMRDDDYQRCTDYWKKDGHELLELGEIPAKRQGKRTDIEEMIEKIKSGEILDIKMALKMYPNYVLSHLSSVERAITLLAPRPERDLSTLTLFHWQGLELEYLKQVPDDRTITFVVDEEGNMGKSFFLNILQDLLPDRRVQVLNPGKRDNLTYKIESDVDIYAIDIARFRAKPKDKDKDVFLHYDVFENLKDGRIDSDKYQCTQKYLRPCHVIITMNEMPDMTALSRDRYRIVQLIASDRRPYDPPDVNAFGSEFSSDMTGDGPVYYVAANCQNSLKKRHFKPAVLSSRKKAKTEESETVKLSDDEHYWKTAKHPLLELPEPAKLPIGGTKLLPKDFMSYNLYENYMMKVHGGADSTYATYLRAAESKRTNPN